MKLFVETVFLFKSLFSSSMQKPNPCPKSFHWGDALSGSHFCVADLQLFSSATEAVLVMNQHLWKGGIFSPRAFPGCSYSEQ